MPRGSHVLPVAATVVGLALAGCGGLGDDDARSTDARPAASRPETPSGPSSAGGRTATTGASSAPGSATGTTPRSAPDVPTATTPATESTGDDAVDPPPRSWDASCPTPTTSPMGCRAVRGRVLSIQSYDPDGDGDLHVIAVGGDVTLPGITVFDVRASLRPARDPVKGEYVTGAGPVFRGSLRQRQIQVDAFRVWRPRR